MDKTHSASINLCPEVRDWADRWIASDKEYIKHRAQFAPEPTRSIAKLILALGQPEAVKKNG
jgi:hypothetical protein